MTTSSEIPMANEVRQDSIDACRKAVIANIQKNKKVTSYIDLNELFDFINILKYLTAELIERGYYVVDVRETDGRTKNYTISWDRNPGSAIYQYK